MYFRGFQTPLKTFDLLSSVFAPTREAANQVATFRARWYAPEEVALVNPFLVRFLASTFSRVGFLNFLLNSRRKLHSLSPLFIRLRFFFPFKLILCFGCMHLVGEHLFRKSMPERKEKQAKVVCI